MTTAHVERADRSLWQTDDRVAWQSALDRYPSVIGSQGVDRLPALDRWYREELPLILAQRRQPHVTLEELEQITKWKMSRGVWRQRNLALVRSNAPSLVVELSVEALRSIPDTTKPIATLARLAGVGPATASAVASAADPQLFPFFDEVVAKQIPEVGAVDFTLRCYARYAAVLRDRARRLGADWTPTSVERALWAAVGGKAGTV